MRSAISPETLASSPGSAGGWARARLLATASRAARLQYLILFGKCIVTTPSAPLSPTAVPMSPA